MLGYVIFHRNNMFKSIKANLNQILLHSGFPQGSILEPLLFIMYMNDLALEIRQSELDMYADDSTLGAASGTLDVIEQKLTTDICNIVNWCDDNRMAIN